jgi:hypothetical protein
MKMNKGQDGYQVKNDIVSFEIETETTSKASEKVTMKEILDKY